jgi:hypothetical protein
VSKKSFTDGLESLFSSSREEKALQTLARPKRKERSGRNTAVAEPPGDEPARERGASRASHQKTFALDIEAFLEDVLNESIREELEREQPRSQQPPKSPEEHSGIDALIRSTLETSEMEVQSGKTKRVTFFFDEGKVERLKAIAKQENIYMREVISRIVAEYLARYERESR